MATKWADINSLFAVQEEKKAQPVKKIGAYERGYMRGYDGARLRNTTPQPLVRNGGRGWQKRAQKARRRSKNYWLGYCDGEYHAIMSRKPSLSPVMSSEYVDGYGDIRRRR